jgi:hypothetical protein
LAAAGSGEARTGHEQARGRTGGHVDDDIAGDRDEARRAQRVDVAAEAEAVFDEGLHARARPAAAPVADADHDVVAGVQVTVHDVDDDRLLERPLVALLVEAHGERLHGGGALARHERPRVVFGRDVVGGRGIAGLEQRPIRIELEGGLEPAAVGQAGRADFVVEDDLAPATGLEPVDVAAHPSREGQGLVLFIQALGCVVGAELFAQGAIAFGDR